MTMMEEMPDGEQQGARTRLDVQERRSKRTCLGRSKGGQATSAVDAKAVHLLA